LQTEQACCFAGPVSREQPKAFERDCWRRRAGRRAGCAEGALPKQRVPEDARGSRLNFSADFLCFFIFLVKMVVEKS